MSRQKATNKFGRLYCNSIENENIKAKYRNIRNNKENSLQTRHDAELKVLRCLFSRSIMANNFSLQHVPFEKYVAMMLDTPKYQSKLDDELRDKLIREYGNMPGIKDGESVYYVPKSDIEPLAAHKEKGQFTEEELKKIEEYKMLLLLARSKE